MANADETRSDDDVRGSYLAISGTVVSDRCFIEKLGRAAFLSRLVYNAAIDRHVVFAEGITYRLALDRSRKTGAPKPAEPPKSETFLPVPKEGELSKALTRLCAANPTLREFPRTLLNNAVSDACRARKAHIEACVAAKAAGGRMPDLHYRSARDGWSVTLDGFWLLRIATDAAQPRPKVHRSSSATAATAARNAKRRRRGKVRRESAWALEKWRCGWSEAAIAAGLDRREARQAADRARQRALHNMRTRPVGLVRRDSPKATCGARRMKADVVGLGRFRIDLGREIPEGAKKVRLALAKPAWRGAKVEVKITFQVAATTPLHDPLESGRRIHDALKDLPTSATPLDAVAAIRGAGLLAHGEDLGSRHASTDDGGVKTPPVRWPRKELAAMKVAQVAMSWKDEVAKTISSKPPVVTVTTVTTGGANAVAPPRRKTRSRNRQRCREVVARLNHKNANRRATRAKQDIARLLKDQPILVATDPKRMVAPLLRKPTTAKPSLGFMSEASKRAMRANLVNTRFALRIRHLETRCRATGVIFATPGHEGTSKTCPACLRVEAKDLRVRVHDCPCGFVADRDHTSALMTLGKALLPFRQSADPEGRIASAIHDDAERASKARESRLRRAEALVKAAAKRRETRTAEGKLRLPGRSAPGPSAQNPKRVRGQGRNVRRAA